MLAIRLWSAAAGLQVALAAASASRGYAWTAVFCLVSAGLAWNAAGRRLRRA